MLLAALVSAHKNFPVTEAKSPGKGGTKKPLQTPKKGL
jgi:hypothetical protein